MNQDWEKTLADADDQQLRDALAQAHIPALMGSLMHLRGNTDHFAAVQPHFELFGEEEDGLEEAQREQIRELAFTARCAYRDAGCPEIPTPTEANVVATMHAITGEPMQDEHIPLLREELNLFGEDRRRVPIDTRQLDDDFNVLIIGSGMSGILAAIRLQQEGIPFQIVEKNPEIGGTWYENTYPGCQVD